MTLVSHAKPPSHHKKLSGKHHRQTKNYHKPYWPYLPLIAIVMSGFLLSSSLPGKPSVLGYATDMSIQSLLDDTNDQRGNNGESALALNGLLDNAAQAKANDMATRNYWSHDTPDGQTPWSFMTAAGYNYQLAGENLAYGFATASDTLTGWMNSPGHRANILNAGYQEVGFGFTNIADYQSNGPETLVVAMYGSPATTPAVTPVTTPTASTTPAANSASSTPAAGAIAVKDTSATQNQASTPTAAPPTTDTAPSSDTLTPTTTTSSAPANKQAQLLTEPKAEKVSRIQVLTAGKAPWSMVALSLAGSIALLAFLLRHGFAWHKVLVKGEKLILHHPVLDILLVSLITAMAILAQGSGVIR
jgi:uncharacterized protein YkwD